MPRGIRKALSHLVFGPFAIAVCLAIRAAYPFKQIKVGTFRATRIGHFTIDAVNTWRLLQMNPKRPWALVWLPEAVTNEFWGEMVRRHFFVAGFFKYVDFWNRLLPLSRRHILDEYDRISRDIRGICKLNRNRFVFTEAEQSLAADWLRSKGWREGEPIVCLLVRDDAYLKSDTILKDVRDWSYHDYRNSRLSDYAPAIEYLLDQGAWVFRMGKIMEARAPVEHPRFVDFAFDPLKSDFMDIWLFSNCDVCVTTATGPDSIPAAYDIQMVEVNTAAPGALRFWARTVYAPKKMVWRESGLPLTIAEQITNTSMNGNEIAQRGIVLRDLTPGEILESVREGWLRSRGAWHDTPEQAELEGRFWRVYRAHPRIREFGPKVNSDCHPAGAWLRALPSQAFEPPVE